MNEYFVECIELSKKAYDLGEIPVGAVVVKNDIIIGRGYNDRQANHNVTGHAEIIAILEAEQFLNDWRLDGCDLYVSLEPCEMCYAIINEARIKNVYFLLNNTYNQNKNNAKRTNVCNNDNFSKIYKEMLINFFNKLR